MADKKICVNVEKLNVKERLTIERLMRDASMARSVYGVKVYRNVSEVMEHDNICIFIDEREFNIDTGLRSAQLRQAVCFDATRDREVSKSLVDWLKRSVFLES